MGRAAATAVHLTLSAVAGVLYFLFVLPRWWELMGDTSHTLGTVLRLVTAALIALAALPVALTLVRTRRTELATPEVALRLRLWSAVAHVLAGVLIAGAAIAEIWLSLDKAGPWLFGVYGAAAAVAILGIGAFYLSFVAEQPPAPPKPPKEEKPRKRRGKKTDEASAGETTDGDEAPAEAESGAEESADETEADEPAAPAAATKPSEKPAEPAAEDGALRNKRPTGKASHRLRRRNRGGVVTDE
ncbi:MAG TPA: hypothetical protein PKI02_13780 [Mycobacterium sp.]|nr:hypothetical protein [Mycobacterium sp.]